MLTIIIIGIVLFLVFNYNTKSRREERKETQQIKKDIDETITNINEVMRKQSIEFKEESKKMLSEVDFLRKAKDLANANKLLEYKELCDDYLEKNPNNYNALFAKADALSLYGKRNDDSKSLNDSIEILYKLNSINKKDKDVLSLLGDNYVKLAVYYAKKEMDEDLLINTANKSAEYYLSAYNLDKTNGDALAEYAFVKSLIGENEIAVKFINEALRLSPNNNRIRTLEQEIKS